jgi:hypothetical protein
MFLDNAPRRHPTEPNHHYFCKKRSLFEHAKLFAIDFRSGVHLELSYLLNINLRSSLVAYCMAVQ